MMRKRITKWVLCIGIFLFHGVFGYSQSGRSQFIFDLTYYEWPDGCLTYKYDMHYQSSISAHGTITTHRNDNSSVINSINNFNYYVKQYNAVQYIKGQQYYKGTYVYYVDKQSYFNPGNQNWTRNGVSGGDPGGTYYIYTCRIWQL